MCKFACQRKERLGGGGEEGFIRSDLSEDEWLDHFKTVLNGDVAAEAEKGTSSGYSKNNEESYDDIFDADNKRT